MSRTGWGQPFANQARHGRRRLAPPWRSMRMMGYEGRSVFASPRYLLKSPIFDRYLPPTMRQVMIAPSKIGSYITAVAALHDQELGSVDQTRSPDEARGFLAVFSDLADALLHWKDAGRWGAGLARRALSILLCLSALATALFVALRACSTPRQLLVVMELATRHLCHPPTRWASA